MAAGLLPQMFFKDRFWLAIVAGLLVVLYFVGKKYPRPFPRSGEFVARHRKAIIAAMDIVVVGTVVLGSMFFLSVFHEDLRTWRDPLQPQVIRAVSFFTLFVDMVVWSGVLGPLVGFHSFFQSDLTKFKRIVLLILCLMPALFTVLALLIGSAEDRRLMILLGVVFSAPGWIENGPSVLIGQPLFHIVWRILCRLHLVSGDVPD